MSLSDELAAAVDAFVRPEYVGENRCGPCTVVNAGLVALAVGLLFPLWAPLAAAVAVGGALAIALRGYVVPYTPEFAPRLAASLPVEFGHVDRAGVVADDGDADATTDARRSDSLVGDHADGDAGEEFGERVTRELLDAGVLVAEGPTLAPSDAFADAWEAEMTTLRRLNDEELADAVGEAAAFDAPARPEDGGVLLDGGEASRFAWLSRPVAVAEAAAVRALTGYDVAESLRPAAARPLRLFTPVCPSCGGRLAETTVADCCGGTMGVYDTPEQEVLACEDCEAVVYEF